MFFDWLITLACLMSCGGVIAILRSRGMTMSLGIKELKLHRIHFLLTLIKRPKYAEIHLNRFYRQMYIHIFGLSSA